MRRRPPTLKERQALVSQGLKLSWKWRKAREKAMANGETMGGLTDKMVEFLVRRYPDMAPVYKSESFRASISRFFFDELHTLFVHADSELSAIACGRPPGDKRTNNCVAWRFRKLYQAEAK